MPKRVRQLALKSALRQKLDENALLVVRLEAFERPKTARLARALASITDGRPALLLTAGYDESLFLSGRNIPRLTMKQFKDVTAYEVLRHPLVLIEAAVVEAAAAAGGEADGSDRADAAEGGVRGEVSRAPRGAVG